MRPTHYTARRHDYVFFPVAWTDEATGTYYEKGYYDENGTRYDHVSFEKDGRYENVVFHCPYCEQETLVNLNASDVSSLSLKCPECGAPMELQSELDQDVSQGEMFSEDMPSARSGGRRKRRLLPIILVVLAVLYLVGKFTPGSKPVSQNQYLPLNNNEENLYDLGDTVSLAKTGSNVYAIDEHGSDKLLTWESEYDSYYDPESDCYLWYNTDVDPSIWQYWYEGISSDYGDYGWMEHYSDGWYIEASDGKWIPLPSKYDAGGLWYIEE